jgi:hypothetical protein
MCHCLKSYLLPSIQASKLLCPTQGSTCQRTLSCTTHRRGRDICMQHSWQAACTGALYAAVNIPIRRREPSRCVARPLRTTNMMQDTVCVHHASTHSNVQSPGGRTSAQPHTLGKVTVKQRNLVTQAIQAVFTQSFTPVSPASRPPTPVARSGCMCDVCSGPW